MTHKLNNKPSHKVKYKNIIISIIDFCHPINFQEYPATPDTVGQEEYPDTDGQEEYPARPAVEDSANSANVDFENI
ncbi:4022_t:CDS:2 [Funneliformis geosporum]|uniref:12675_t:CDS:1 n=1 Tax=Funneliformis geosporum TaxID=1117311 RepID=A0A9W4SKJ3_9GLOM|nr:12675_t:CDS:2 [Funneliformis geosporum]CAI2184277.1 4022_t:CDS:2 [Funneliformis geosporum]